MNRSTLRRLLIAIGILFLLAVIGVIALCAFPWGMMRGTVQARLSDALGRPVSIGAVERVDRFSLSPVVAIHGLRIAQPGWVGGGDLARVKEVRVGFDVLPLLAGHFKPTAIDISGMTVTLVRSADGRESWRKGPADEESRKSGHPAIEHLTVRDSVVVYRDAKRDRGFTARLAADVAKGVTLDGTGQVQGNPVNVHAEGARVDAQAAGKPWAFRAAVEGPAVGVTLNGKMDRPLDVGHFSAAATGHASDLKLLDAVIEAGLPATQPVTLAAQVRHEAPDWIVTGLHGLVGRSDIAGRATIRKKEGRHEIDAAIRSSRFDFDDLSSDAGKAKAAAKRASYGKRLIPDTAIDLDNVRNTDGTLAFDVEQLVWSSRSPIKGVHGVIRVDHSRLTIAPLSLPLARGRMDGRISIDQRGHGPVIDLQVTLNGARLIDFVPDAGVDGVLQGAIRLHGAGRTVRAAVGASSGTVALVARDGVIPFKTAALLGQDVGHGLFGQKRDPATLRCLIARLDVAGGLARADPMLIDTSRALSELTGTINLSTEAMALSLHGTPKTEARLRIDGPIPIRGTIKSPDVQIPEQTKSLKGIFKIFKRALSDEELPIADDLDCGREAARALR